MIVTHGVDAIGRLVAQFDKFRSNGVSAAPAWLNRLREEAFQRFTELGFPTTRQENWRLTSVKAISIYLDLGLPEVFVPIIDAFPDSHPLFIISQAYKLLFDKDYAWAI